MKQLPKEMQDYWMKYAQTEECKAAIRRGMESRKEGRMRPWKEVAAELGITLTDADHAIS